MSNPRKTLLLRFDRALSNSLLKQIGILVLVLVATILVSFLFLSISKTQWIEICHDKNISPFLLPLYLLIDQNAFNSLYMDGTAHGWTLIACCLTYLCGVIIFNGMLVGVIVNAINERVEDHRNGLTHYLNSGHYVIMGYDDMVPSVIEDVFSREPQAYVLLLTAFDAKQINEKLKKSVAKKKLDQIIVNYGQRTASEYYPEIHLESAKEIIIVGRRTQPYHDAVNIECIDSICSYLSNHKSEQMPRRITCVFEDLDTYAAFKTSEIFGEVSLLGIEFVPYNFYAGWARQVFATRSYKEKSDPTKAISYPSVYGNGIGPKDNKQVHLVFVGTTNFAVSFAMEAAHMLHFPNFDQKTKSPKTRITFIEKNMKQEMPLFITRNRHLFEVQSYIYRDLTKDSTQTDEIIVTDRLSSQFNDHDFLDVEFEFIKGDVYSKEVQALISEWSLDNERQCLSIFLSLADQRLNFMMGMNMPDEVYDNAIPVFIRQDRADDFVTNLRKADDKELDYNYVENGELKTIKRKGRYAHLYPFGMDDMAYCNDERVMRQAKLINYLYETADYSTLRFTETHELDAKDASAIWSDAERFWNKLTVALKWSNLYCAYGFPCKLASLRVMRGLDPDDASHDLMALSDDEVETLAHVEHNRWNVEKLLMGFQKPSHDEDKYAHPEFKKQLQGNKKLFIHHDLRPFRDLDDVWKLDYEIVKHIPWILKMTE